MSPAWRRAALALVLLGASAAALAAAEEPLGDAARREKERRARTATQKAAGRVYTNEDLEAARAGEAPSNLSVISSSASEPAPQRGQANPDVKSPSGRQDGDAPAAGPSEDRPRRGAGEEEWRGRAQRARAAVESGEQALAEGRTRIQQLQERLSPMAQLYVQDPNERLRLEAELTAAQEQLEQAERGLAAAQQAYRELLDEAQRQRVPPGWVSNAS